MSKGQGLLQRISGALSSLGIRPPWKFTGPTSSPEYMNHLPKAVEYRVHGPASPPLRASVPQADPNLVYNIKYYPRDSRRATLPGGTKKIEKTVLDSTTLSTTKSTAPTAALGEPYRWKGPPRSILDVDNNGYTL